MSRADLAAACGLSPSSIANYESGKPPSRRAMASLSSVLGTDIIVAAFRDERSDAMEKDKQPEIGKTYSTKRGDVVVEHVDETHVGFRLERNGLRSIVRTAEWQRLKPALRDEKEED